MKLARGRNLACLCLWIWGVAAACFAMDWPMWRYDVGRTASSPETLPNELHLQWMMELPPLEPAWSDQPRMVFDQSYEPIAAGDLLYVASSRNDSVSAFDSATGQRTWRFFAEGPVRLAPAFWKGKLYVSSDDGHLYCLDGRNGEVIWRFNGAPGDRKVWGNERLISNWPSRGGPVVEEGRVYVTMGLWPFMGVFIYCLDAETGEVLWLNDETGSMYILQPHNSPAFAGVAPQGYCVLDSGRLLIPGGRSVPACFDAKTGSFAYYHLAQNNKWGNSHVSSQGGFFANDGRLFDILTGAELCSIPGEPVFSQDGVYGTVGRVLKALGTSPQPVRQGDRIQLVLPELWTQEIPLTGTLIRAGHRLYLGGKDFVCAMDLEGESARVSWTGKLEGFPTSLIASHGRLFVVMKAGQIYCFAGKEGPPIVREEAVETPGAKDEWTQRADEILKKTGLTEGIVQVWGLGSGRLAEELARQSNLHVIVVHEDEMEIQAFRERMDRQGLYGKRVTILSGIPTEYPFPPYLASLIVSENATGMRMGHDSDATKKLYQCLRPFGGTACLKLEADGHAALSQLARTKELPGAQVERMGDRSLLVRAGSIPGSANWTHQYADVANTCVSKDSAVRVPLGILWFGGPPHHSILPRHGHGPIQHVVDGRLTIQGPDILRTVDVYTGRLLWEKDLPGIGEFYNNTSHQPGANSLGSNYVSKPDGIYVAYKEKILRLDPKTGNTLSTFTLPILGNESTSPSVGYIGIYKELLLAGASPIDFDDSKTRGRQNSWNGVASESLVVMDRHKGTVLWSHIAKQALRHNAICAGNGRIFIIDRLPQGVLDEMKRRGEDTPMGGELFALDARMAQKDYTTWRKLFEGGFRRKGVVLWRTQQGVFGSWLSYSEDHDILLQAGRPSRDMLGDEPGDRMIAYRGADGKVLWDERINYQGPCLIHGDTIITQGEMYDLHTGSRKSTIDPLTGKERPWSFSRNYGCNTAIGSQNLLTFRSAAAGFFDLENHGGTGNFGGFRSGCTSNLIAANGVLNAPDYTRTCVCSYQIQTSLALIPMDEIYTWTFFDKTPVKGRIQRVGINLGAPGDRLADDGTLWLEAPMVGGPSPDLSVTFFPETPGRFTHEPIRYEGLDPRWVAASGCEGFERMTLDLYPGTDPPMPGKPDDKTPSLSDKAIYTVKLYFAEPRDLKLGERVFSVQVQGQTVLQDLDILAQAGGPRRLIVHEIPEVQVDKILRVDLVTGADSSWPGLLCGLEAIARPN